MTDTQPVASDRRASPLLSNNPFRNHVPSEPQSPAVPLQGGRPISTNPFLDSTEIGTAHTLAAPAPTMPNGNMSPEKKTFTDNTTELFEGLSFENKSPRRGHEPPLANGVSRRAENIPPRPQGRIPHMGHRPSHSKEERERMAGRPRGPTGQLDIFADPPDMAKARERRPRRNSDTSIISGEKTRKFLDPDDERRRQERRQRDARRHGRSKPAARRLDIIDKLDVTSIYGTGLFHHDGPFDACNPARNRKGVRAAPMQAFPKDSRNMSLGGSGPNNSKLNLDQIHGTGHEAHIDYNKSGIGDGFPYDHRRPNPERSASFNPLDRVEPVHGEESVGLGTSTFLEGAPASRAAIQRRATEDESSMEMNSLSRKKSLAQKIRGVRPSARMTSPEPGMKSPTSPLGTGMSQSSANPFFKDYDQEYEKKGAQIASAEEKQGRTRAPSSPRRMGLGLERKITAESIDGVEEGKSAGGFLSRVKSLKGGPRRTRGERREVSG